MVKVIKKYKNIYMFIIIVAIIGILSGYIYGKYQPIENKEQIEKSINIEEILSNSTNNSVLYLKKNIKITLLSLTPITAISNIISIYYEPFTIGFIINTFSKYPFKFKITFLNIYYIIPLLFTLLIIKNSLGITYEITKKIVKKDKNNKTKKLIKKQILLIIISLTYELIIWLYSGLINNYLIKII